jgi:hypothetical protein
LYNVFFVLLLQGPDLDYSLKHRFVFDPRGFACIIDQIIQGYKESVRQFLATSTDGTISPRSYLPIIGPLVPTFLANCCWLQLCCLLNASILSPIAS